MPPGRRLAASAKTRTRAGRTVGALRAAYRPALRAAVAASAAPYGYTLTIWTSGAVLSHTRGIPSAVEALLFLVGAVAAFALVGGLAVGGRPQRLAPEPAHAVI
jgi:hypothetical protein